MGFKRFEGYSKTKDKAKTTNSFIAFRSFTQELFPIRNTNENYHLN